MSFMIPIMTLFKQLVISLTYVVNQKKLWGFYECTIKFEIRGYKIDLTENIGSSTHNANTL